MSTRVVCYLGRNSLIPRVDFCPLLLHPDAEVPGDAAGTPVKPLLTEQCYSCRIKQGKMGFVFALRAKLFEQ